MLILYCVNDFVLSQCVLRQCFREYKVLSGAQRRTHSKVSHRQFKQNRFLRLAYFFAKYRIQQS